ncbi:3-carboxyethylcatechol 2,3-dioxygenase [Nocardia sp. NBC_01327]|uniref:DODA-type extradiol aromatic ring-opening family dioxygenase n=1 Tax=Nocardia sp. NBC_01327 TaxID=2903593 RepID=UPI002E0D105C|nr:3-carboxyethylcatechol 2,3-dioxygenase [Nocardia sp. NBC_01327]
MSEIVGLVAVSHSPFAHLLPPDGPTAPGARFLADTARVAAVVARLAPDAVVLIGPDHFHATFYDLMPPFVLGVEQATGFGDFGSRPGPVAVADTLAWSIRQQVTAAGFDLALSYALTVDHGIVQSYEMICGTADIPMVPLVVNTTAPPLPTLSRCADLGRALGDALRAAEHADRVLLIASGGLSHWLPSADPRDPDLDRERRAGVIHGGRDPHAFDAAREPRIRALGGDPNARVNIAWDTWFLDRLRHSDLASITALADTELEHVAGRGGNEIRNWLIGAAAAAAPFVWTSYEPVPEWITGMGIGTTFPVHQQNSA